MECVSLIPYHNVLKDFLRVTYHFVLPGIESSVLLVYYSSLHQRKPTGVHLHRPQFHHEEEDGALERGNGADRTLAAGQTPHILFMHFARSTSQSLPDPAFVPLFVH